MKTKRYFKEVRPIKTILSPVSAMAFSEVFSQTTIDLNKTTKGNRNIENTKQKLGK